MDHKTIITYLIIQEFKYVQLIYGLEKLGFIYEDNTFTLIDVFQPIIGIKAQNDRKYPGVSDQLQDTYNKWLDKAMLVEMDNQASFANLANLCYQEILEIINRDNNIDPNGNLS